MKSFCAAVVVLGVLFVGADAKTWQERRDFEASVFRPCAQESGATEAEVQSLLNYEPPRSRAACCMAACAHKKVNMIQGPYVNYHAFLNVGKTEYEGDSPAIAKFEPMARKCSNPSSTDSDPCNLSQKIYLCMNQYCADNGYVISQGFTP